MRRILIGATLLVAGIIGVAGASPVSADKDNPAVCNGTHITPPANTTEVTVTAPEGKLISGYCVKAGSFEQGLGPEYVTFAEPVTSVTIVYSGTVKDISHYVVTYVDVPVGAPEPEAVTPVTPDAPPPTCEAEGNGEECEPQVASNPPPATPAAPVTPVAPIAVPTVGPVGGSATPADPAVASAGPVPPQATPTALPATGTSSWVLAFLGMGLVLLGTGFVGFSRRLS